MNPEGGFGLNNYILTYEGITECTSLLIAGDVLMGADGKPRTVTAVERGRDVMYAIRQSNGSKYTLSRYFPMCLTYVSASEGNTKPAKETEICVADFLSSPEEIQREAKGYIANLDFEPEKESKLPGYLIGLCTTFEGKEMRCSRERRMDILAGLVDAYGRPGKGSYHLTLFDDIVAEQIMFLARSLGFKCIGLARMLNGDYLLSVDIIGDVQTIPVHLPENMVQPTQKPADIDRYNALKIEVLGEQEYIRPILSEPGRLLLSDFTVISGG